MAVIETKYSVGDVVYLASTTTERKQHPCPDCKGTRQWSATSPAGEEYSIACPRCSASYRSKDELSLDYTAAVPTVRRLTIGSIRTDSHGGAWGDEEPVAYMCNETGVGSGNIWKESMLHRSESDALQAATIMAAKQNAETPWIANLYNKSLSVSDYQFSSAALKAADDLRYRAKSLLWNLNDLFDAINEANDLDAVAEAVGEYKEWHWKSDLAQLAAQGMAARSDETPQAAQPVGQQPVPQDAPEQDQSQ